MLFDTQHCDDGQLFGFSRTKLQTHTLKSKPKSNAEPAMIWHGIHRSRNLDRRVTYSAKEGPNLRRYRREYSVSHALNPPMPGASEGAFTVGVAIGATLPWYLERFSLGLPPRNTSSRFYKGYLRVYGCSMIPQC